MHSIWVAWGIGYEIGVLSSGVKMGINNVGKWDGEMGRFGGHRFVICKIL